MFLEITNKQESNQSLDIQELKFKVRRILYHSNKMTELINLLETLKSTDSLNNDLLNQSISINFDAIRSESFKEFLKSEIKYREDALNKIVSEKVS